LPPKPRPTLRKTSQNRSEMMNAEALVVHNMAGRIRIRVPSKKGNAAYFTAVKETLSACVGVEGVEVAPFTGSILVRCHGPTEAVLGWAESQGLFVVRQEQSIKVTAFYDSVAGRFGALDDGIKTATGKSFDLPGLAFLGLMGAGIYQIARGNFATPAWYTAFWYALGLFWKSSEKKGGKDAEGTVE
jgi:hypothetical protein